MKILALTFCLFTATGSYAATIDFETGAPPTFGQTSPLSNYYASSGVTFSGLGGNGGSILDQEGNFGINAHSGVDFLAFNTRNSAMGETVSFSTQQSMVSIYAGSRSAGSYTLSLFNGSTLLGSNTILATAGNYGFLSLSASGITSATIVGTPSDFVLDDLSFTASPATTTTPEPSSLMLLGTGVLGIAGAARRRFAKL